MGVSWYSHEFVNHNQSESVLTTNSSMKSLSMWHEVGFACIKHKLWKMWFQFGVQELQNMYHSFRLHHLAAFRFFYQASQHMSVVAIVYNFPHYISPLRQFLNKTMKCDNNEKLDRSFLPSTVLALSSVWLAWIKGHKSVSTHSQSNYNNWLMHHWMFTTLSSNHDSLEH